MQVVQDIKADCIDVHRFCYCVVEIKNHATDAIRLLRGASFCAALRIANPGLFSDDQLI